uniref:Uncharacterized protein n=1 Tax=Cyanoderma ruficeps TaxID=181631 RepID=A0A8C3QM58_9PASS
TKPRKDPAAVNIFAAVAEGSLPELEKTLKDNDLNVLNPSRETLLHVAAAHGQISILEYLLTLRDESSPAKMLLEAGASAEGEDERGQTALTGYSKDLSADIMESALFRAVQKNLHSVVAALIDRGTDINAHNTMHYTPLLLACEMGRAGAASISGLLLSKGMDTNVRNQAEETPPHIAAFQNNGALIGLLVTAGARINAVTKYFVTALHVASQRGHADAARQLLHHEAHVNAQDKQAKCPLHLAAEQGDKTLAEMLLKARADPNAQDKEKTPLQAAALRGHLSAVEVLLANRAGAKDTDGWNSPAYCSGVRTRRVGKSPCRASGLPSTPRTAAGTPPSGPGAPPQLGTEGKGKFTLREQPQKDSTASSGI